MGYDGLTNQHLKALDLLKQGRFTYVDIAGQIGVHVDTLRGWVNGDDNAGPTAALFSAEWNKIRKQMDQETTSYMRAIQRTLSDKLSKWSEGVVPTDLPTIKVMRGVLATVADAQKQDVDITQIFNYSNNVEDIVSEARRLSSIADAALGRRADPSLVAGRPGKVPGKPKARNQVRKALQVHAVRSKPKAGSVSPEQGADTGSVRGEQVR